MIKQKSMYGRGYKLGFTLVELLAVIVILAVILVIAVPQIMNVIDSASTSAFEATAKLIAKNAERIYTEKEMLGDTSSLECGDVAKYSSSDYENCEIIKVDSKVLVNMKGKGKFANKWVCGATSEIAYISNQNCNSYIQSGLVVRFGGINNDGTGTHNLTTTTWKNLAGTSHDGIINGATWGSNYLNFDGINGWVNLGELNQDTYTLEAMIIPTAINMGGENHIISNTESGGYAIFLANGCFSNTSFINNGYRYQKIPNDIILNNKYVLSGTYSGYKLNSYINGILEYSLPYEGAIGVPRYHTIMAIGCNPSGNQCGDSSWFTGRIYSIRIYNRALSDAEVWHNYVLDLVRYS